MTKERVDVSRMGVREGGWVFFRGGHVPSKAGVPFG